MAEFFDRWSPGQFTLLVMTVGIAAAVVVFILSVAHYQLRALADHTALERERAQAGFALREQLVRRNLPAAELQAALVALGLEAVGSSRATPDDDQTADLLKGLLACGEGVEAEDMEATAALAAAADPATRRALARVLADAAENGYEGERVFAAVRAVGKAARKPEPADPNRAVDLRLESGYAAG
ncbi:MAG: hypothetical protein K2X87_03975 [Gemmataceae bacterium]|nr:hypothetical protein [Gemmataceae bacterium]